MNCPIEPSIEVLKFRHQAKRSILSFFDAQGFLEIDTPYLLSSNTPDPFIDPIMAIAQGAGRKTILQLHTSPEIWLKKVMGMGLERIFHMARVFRDDPPGRYHNREFIMLEWYRAHQKLPDLLNDCREILGRAQKAAEEAGIVEGQKIPDFIETDLDHLFRDLAGLDLSDALEKISKGKATHLQECLSTRGDLLPRRASFSDAFFHVMIKYIEPNLPFHSPVVISRWPIQLAALAAPCHDDPRYCDRFEIYYRGVELANAYQECTDQQILRSRFIAENVERSALGKPKFAIDESFLASIDHMPSSAGIAMGIDRLLMTVAKKSDLSQIILGQAEAKNPGLMP